MVSERKHAPGPWSRHSGRVVDVRGKPVVLRGFALSTGVDPDWAETDANSDLALAAPELLAVCEAAREALRFVEAADIPEFERGWLEEIEALDAAIAKAKPGKEGVPCSLQS